MFTRNSCWPAAFAPAITLIEMLIVLTGACILAAAAAPSVHRWQKEWTLWGSARLLQDSLQWGRMYAVSANTSLVLTIDMDGHRFYWADPSTGERYESSLRYLPAGVRIVGYPRRRLRFFPRGNAAPAGTFIIQGEAGFYRVVVNIAGRIRVEKD